MRKTALNDLIDNINDAAKNAKATWLGLIAVSVYLLTILVSVTHLDFILQRPLRLPIVGTLVPVDKFFFFAPLILVIVYAWCVMAHAILMQRIEIFEHSDENKDGHRQRLSPYLVVQSLSGPSYGWPSKVVLFSSRWLAIHGFTLALLLYFQASYLPNHSTPMLWWHRVLLLCAIFVFVLVDRSVFRGSVKRTQISAKVAASTPLLLTSILLFSGYDEPIQPEIPGVISNDVDLSARRPISLFSRVLILPLYDLSGYSEPGTRLPLQQKDLRGGQFAGSNFDFVDATGANFADANVSRTSFNAAKVQGAILDRADFYGATMFAVDARNSSFVGSNLTLVQASGGNFEGSDFTLSNMQNMFASSADFQNSTLTGVDMRNSLLANAKPPRADVSDRDWYKEADFRGADTSGIEFENPFLEDLKEFAENFSPSFRRHILSGLDRARARENNCPYCEAVWISIIEFSDTQSPALILDRISQIACHRDNVDFRIVEAVVRHRLRPPGWETQNDLSRAQESRLAPAFDQVAFARKFLEQQESCSGAGGLSREARRVLEDIIDNDPESFFRDKEWLDLTPNQNQVPEVSASGSYRVSADAPIAIYGARDKNCQEAPKFSSVMREILSHRNFKFEPEWGTLLDGGVSRRFSRSCNADVEVRVISMLAHSEFSGEIQLNFFDSDTVNIRINLD